MGVAIINITEEFTLIQTLVNGVGAAIGFTLAIVLFAGIRERLELSRVPKAMKLPAALAGLREELPHTRQYA